MGVGAVAVPAGHGVLGASARRALVARVVPAGKGTGAATAGAASFRSSHEPPWGFTHSWPEGAGESNVSGRAGEQPAASEQ
jgi:hypothetical protein